MHFFVNILIFYIISDSLGNFGATFKQINKKFTPKEVVTESFLWYKLIVNKTSSNLTGIKDEKTWKDESITCPGIDSGEFHDFAQIKKAKDEYDSNLPIKKNEFYGE